MRKTAINPQREGLIMLTLMELVDDGTSRQVAGQVLGLFCARGCSRNGNAKLISTCGRTSVKSQKVVL